MYAKRYRLEFGKRRFTAEAGVRLRFFSAKIAPSSSGHNHFAIIIPRAAVKKAVRRNFWKRTIADHIKGWPNADKSFLIYVLRGIEGLPEDEVKKELDKIFKKSALRK